MKAMICVYAASDHAFVTCVSTENTVFHIGLKMGKIVHLGSKKVDVGLFKKQTVRHFFQIVFSLDFILMCQSMGINLENLPQIHCFEEY